ncbi:MAG: S1 RNA-binding domain-containing protein [Candidatus Wildermuthbacteria bacterium]|nr:S1 RNA-binding domain-containing protein [Candidatus Wildermuthbacteria bacterium]
MINTIKPQFMQKLDIPKPYRVGDIIEASVIAIGRSAIYLDLAPQGTGIIFGKEFLEEKRALKSVKIGDKIAAKITNLENDECYIELSLGEAGRQITWSTLKEQKENEITITVKIMGANKGGLLTELNGIQAFLPVSQLAPEHYPKVEGGDPSKILKELQSFMGKELEVQIFDIDPKENKIILSERAKERLKLKELLKNYKVGDVVEGQVTGIVDFGAFITFPTGEQKAETAPNQQLEGLIHISEIDWQIIDDPAQFLKVGQNVTAKIIDISNGRVSLSLKALKEDPWKGIENKYKKEDTVDGKVTKINPFGAFVEIEPRIQGLAHVSEFGTKKKLDEELEAGKTYPFQILEVNPTEHRMSLRLATLPAPSPVPQPSSEAPTTEQKPETAKEQS